MIILVFFVLHWQLAVFFQSFFLHRYSAHRQFTMSKRWERFFHFTTWLVQGSSYLSPRAYAVLHRMHHAYSDTPRDPHSPIQQTNFLKMMFRTKRIYDDLKLRRVEPEARFLGGYPEWDLVDKTLSSPIPTIMWGTAYTIFYLVFATHWWMFILLPFQCYLGATHGSIVNWFGHKYGYRNFENGDASRNTLPIDFLTMGELFQNNHHKFGMSPNFAVRWFEMDPTYQVIRVLAWLRIIDVSGAQRPKYGRVEASAAAE